MGIKVKKKELVRNMLVANDCAERVIKLFLDFQDSSKKKLYQSNVLLVEYNRKKNRLTMKKQIIEPFYLL